ncbi:MAG: hypothetical protein V4539_21855 [Bacteroidota bacterium]
MKILFTLLFAGITATGFSQANPAPLSGSMPGAKYTPLKKESSNAVFLQKLRDQKEKESARNRRVLIDSILTMLQSSPKQQPSIDNMSNAIAVQQFPSSGDVYKGNNREGFDIYESRIDRMAILKPDSLNAAQLTRRK